MTDSAQRVEDLNSTALVLYERGDHEHALTVAHQALRLADQSPADRTIRVVSLNNLGLILTALGEFSEAGHCYAEILASLEQSPGTDQPARAVLLGNVAAFYQETGRFAEARKLYDDAAGIISRTLGEASEDFANVSANLGDMCEDLGEYEESERHLGHALQIHRHLDDSDHRADVVRVLNTLGVLRKTRGDYVAANRSSAKRLTFNAPHQA